MKHEKHPRGNGGGRQGSRQETPAHLQNTPAGYDCQPDLEDARQVYLAMKRPRLVLGYYSDNLEATTRWAAPAISWTREEVATAAADFFEHGYERFQGRKLSREELLQLAEWFCWAGSCRDAARREEERDRRAVAYRWGVAL